MSSGNLAAAAAFFEAMARRVERSKHESLERAAQIVEDKAKAAIGTYDYDWPDLADATQDQRVSLGFPANEPELRTGDLRDSIHHKVEGNRAVIGSDKMTAVYAELGTSKAPARPIFGPTIIQNHDEIGQALGRPFHAALIGKSLHDD